MVLASLQAGSFETACKVQSVGKIITQVKGHWTGVIERKIRQIYQY